MPDTRSILSDISMLLLDVVLTIYIILQYIHNVKVIFHIILKLYI